MGTDEHWETENCKRDPEAFSVVCKLEQESNESPPYALLPTSSEKK